jgi:hypothetical protein
MPVGGAIILGSSDGIPLTVAVADCSVVVSCIILVGTGIRVSLLVAVGVTEGTSSLLLGLPVGISMIGISKELELELELGTSEAEVGVADGMLAGVLVGSSGTPVVPFVDMGGRLDSVGTSGSAELVDVGPSSDTGILVEVGVAVSGVPLVPEGITSVPDAVPVEGNTPDAVPVSDGESPVEVGGAPDEALGGAVGRTSVGRLEESEEAMLEMMLGIGTGAVPVGIIDPTSEATLDTILETKLDTSGTAVGRPETTDDITLERSGSRDETIGSGVTPGAEVGALGPVAGSVTPKPELGITPGMVSDGSTGDCDILSDVGMGAAVVGVGAVESPVPRAVVMPTKMPELDVGIAGELLSEGNTEPPVGSTRVSGIPPVPVGPTLGKSDGRASDGSGTFSDGDG